jgi:hypothetical protein
MTAQTAWSGHPRAMFDGTTARAYSPLMAAGSPPWLPHRGILDDRDRYAAMTPEERLEVFADVCELARTILEARPDRARILADVEPMPAGAEATWLRLVREARRERSPR